jgi:hypothetical protein|tara:strand:+ start:1743 stop:2231 length:489 start_codon:yes stop_codon:yes gene_type:complete
MSLLYNIKYNLDEALLKQEAYSSEYEPFVDPLTETVMPLWLMCKKVSGYGAVVAKDFRNILHTDVKPRFIIQKKGFVLNFHKDRGTKCAINFILSTSKDPIRFRTDTGMNSFQYKQALIDVQTEHEVKAAKEDRYLFKLSVPNINFNEALERILAYENLQPK